MEIKLVPFLIFVILFSSCALPEPDYYYETAEPILLKIKENYKPKVVDGDPEPATFPDLEVDRRTALGIDSDDDGVRDDIEIYINYYFEYDYERWNAKNGARENRKMIKNFDKLSDVEKKKIIQTADVESFCDSYIYGIGLRETANSKNYFSADIYYNTTLRRSYLERLYSHLKDGDRARSDTGEWYDCYSKCPKEIQEKYPFKKSKFYNK
jgi:hypothetical protein